MVGGDLKLMVKKKSLRPLRPLDVAKGQINYADTTKEEEQVALSKETPAVVSEPEVAVKPEVAREPEAMPTFSFGSSDKKVRQTILLPEDLRDAVESVAHIEGVAVSEWVEMVLRNHLVNNGWNERLGSLTGADK
jgi:hypothetical protein